MEDQSMDRLSTAYMALRLERDQLKLAYEADDAVLSEAMASIENQMLDIMNTTNADSISTRGATVIRSVRKRYNPTFVFDCRGILNPGRIDEYKTQSGQDKPVKDFLEQHPDEYPAGLNVDSRYAVTVRRKSST